MIKPIRPEEIAAVKKVTLPDGVIQAFNELIVEKFHNGTATILQKDAVALIITKITHADKQMVFDKGWLHIEDVYRSEGWDVRLSSVDDSSDTYYQFSKKVGAL